MRHELLLGELRIQISEDCVGSAQCVSVAPAIFRLDDEGLATFVGDALLDDATAAVAAEALCPTAAIRIAPA